MVTIDINEYTKTAFAATQDFKLLEIRLENGIKIRETDIKIDNNHVYITDAIVSNGDFTAVAFTSSKHSEDIHTIHLFDTTTIHRLSFITFSSMSLHNYVCPNPITQLRIKSIKGSNYLFASSQYHYLHLSAIDNTRLVFIRSLEITS